MKCLAVILVTLAVMACFLVIPSEASYCPCDIYRKEGNQMTICGSNQVTYQNRCEFECTQREYRRLGRTLNLQHLGHC